MRSIAFSLMLVAAPTLAHADKQRRPAPPAAAAPTNPLEPSPGTCNQIQAGVKVCATIDGKGAFDVYTFPPAFVFIQVDEDISRIVPPAPNAYKAGAKDQGVTVVPLIESLPDSTPLVIITPKQTVTINLRRGSRTRADTQVTIKDPRRVARDVELEKRIAEAEQKLEQRAQTRAESILLEELLQGGADLGEPRNKAIARNDEKIVLRAKEIVRVGRRRFLLFSVENRSEQPFEVRGVRLSVGGAESPTPWKIARTTITTAEEVPGVALLPLPSTPSPRTHVRLLVEEVNARRNVEVPDVELP